MRCGSPAPSPTRCSIDLPDQRLIVPGDSLITATYDARTNQITVNDVKASGGSGIVRIVGALVNTNNLGNIQVNGGEGHVTVDNQTSVPLDVGNIYTGSSAAADASTSIIDLLDTNSGVQTSCSTTRASQGIRRSTPADHVAVDGRPEERRPVVAPDGQHHDVRSAGRLAASSGTSSRSSPAANGAVINYPSVSLPNWTFDVTNSGDPDNPWLFACYARTYVDRP